MRWFTMEYMMYKFFSIPSKYDQKIKKLKKYIW